MKITPLWLFLILLFVLVLSILFSNFFPLNNAAKEGFVSFDYNKQPIDYIYIPQYSSKQHDVVKLYDNIFYDTINGNLLEVDGTTYVAPTTSGNVDGNVITDLYGNITGNVNGNIHGNVDTTYNSISGVYVVKRDGNANTNPYRSTFGRDYVHQVSQAVIPVDTPESLITSLNSAYVSWHYTTVSKNTDTYQVFYMPWNTTTYVHIIRLTSGIQHVSSFLFGSGNVMETFNYSSAQQISTGVPLPDTDASNNSSVVNTDYNPTSRVYQISRTVQFDQATGNLIILNGPGKITVYNRYGNPITNYKTVTSSLANTSFTPWIVPDAANNMVLYMPVSTNTVVAILSLDTTSSALQSFKIANTVRFNNKGVDTPPPNNGGSHEHSGNKYDFDDKEGPYSEYYKWLAYWHTNSGSPYDYTSDDYILKTQIIPPVCPTCPTCPSAGGTCTNCGGQGGSGTVNQSGASLVDDKHPVASTVSNTVSTAGNVVTNVVDNAADLGMKGIAGASDVASSAITGASNVVTSVSHDVTGLASNVVTGVANVLTPGQGYQSQGQYQSQPLSQSQYQPSNQAQSLSQTPSYGTVQQGNMRPDAYTGVPSNGNAPGVDNYSYYGALPQKTSNFVPVTADFSSFGK